MQCTSCDGNKGHNFEDVYALLRTPFGIYLRTGKKQTVTTPQHALTLFST
jgi:hypothetical protein